MKEIEPVNIWVNGGQKQAEYLNAYAINVKLDDSATFYWELYTKVTNEDGEDVPGEQLSQGNIAMNPIEYQLWQEDSVAWDFIAFKLNLTII
jgi:hypothetical protein